MLWLTRNTLVGGVIGANHRLCGCMQLLLCIILVQCRRGCAFPWLCVAFVPATTVRLVLLSNTFNTRLAFFPSSCVSLFLLLFLLFMTNCVRTIPISNGGMAWCRRYVAAKHMLQGLPLSVDMKISNRSVGLLISDLFIFVIVFVLSSLLVSIVCPFKVIAARVLCRGRCVSSPSCANQQMQPLPILPPSPRTQRSPPVHLRTETASPRQV